MQPRFYRIYLHSKDKLFPADTFDNAAFAVDLPDLLDPAQEYQIAVETFHSTATATAFYPFTISCSTVAQGNSYSTHERGPNTVLLALDGNNYMRELNFQSIGCKALDSSFLRSRMLRITFRAIDGGPVPPAEWGANPSWIMSLVVFPVPPLAPIS